MQERPATGPETAPLSSSLLRLVADLLAAISQRIDLAGVESRIALRRSIAMMAWGFAATFIALIALVLLTLGVILYFWEENPITALLAAGGVYAILAVIAAVITIWMIRSKPLPMQTLAAVLKEDKEWILGRKPD